MTPAEAVSRLNTVLAHAWMIRTFLKHADEIQASEGMLEVPRTLYDSIRAVEPAFQRGDHGDFLRRLKGKLPKLRRVAEYFRDHFQEFSPHTNYHMASASLLGVVQQMEEIFAALDWNEVAELIRQESANPDRKVGGDPEGKARGGPANELGSVQPPHDPLDDIEIPEV